MLDVTESYNTVLYFTAWETWHNAAHSNIILTAGVVSPRYAKVDNDLSIAHLHT